MKTSLTMMTWLMTSRLYVRDLPRVCASPPPIPTPHVYQALVCGRGVGRTPVPRLHCVALSELLLVALYASRVLVLTPVSCVGRNAQANPWKRLPSKQVRGAGHATCTQHR